VDADLHLARIAEGDADAFAAWLSAAEHEVRLSLRAFAAVVDTEAVLQEALLRVWQAAPRVVPDGRPNALLRFAVRTARNTALSELRRRRSRVLEPEAFERAADAASLDAAGEGPDVLLREATRECVERLPPKPREAMVARLHGSGLVPDERLAEGLSMRKNTFLQNVTRAKRALLECLREKGIVFAWATAHEAGHASDAAELGGAT
jgi:RNA polymerase sigma-70 factor (ECF subfamily)